MSDANLYDIESEKAVIGSIILRPDAIERIWGRIEPRDFFDEHNCKIFRAAMHLYAKGCAIDHITLGTQLTSENGGKEDWRLHLSGMLSGIPDCLHIESYAETVAELADKRRLLSCSQNLAAAIEENNGIEAAKADLQAAVEHNRRGGADPWDKATFTLADAYKPRPAVEYAVENLFPLPSLSIVYGAPGCLKSALLADLAVCTAAGLPWLPKDAEDIYGRLTERLPVQWIDLDNGDITHNRFEAFGRARGISENADLHYTVMPHPWLDASDAEQIAALD